MKNILRVFKNDLNKIHNNVIAMIVIMGILVIPTLYAWFNIAASWDPYGSTDGLKIAVASEDAGYTSELINVDLNLGDDVIKALKENDNFNWAFTDADDAGFEKADNFTADNKIIDSVSSTKDDKKSGAACAHWYNAGTDVAEAEITYKNAITLASGEYIFEYAGQGADGDQLYAKAVDSKGNVIAKGDNVTLAGWKNWKTPSVSFKLEKETKVTLVVGIVSAKGGWGTVDDLYLYQTKSADKSDADNGNTGDDDNNKPDTPSTDDNNKDNTGNGDTATQPAKALTPGAVVASISDTKTTVKDTNGILPDTVKFESKKVTDEKEVAKVADVVKNKIVGVKDVLIYELNLTDGTTQLHQLADKVQVTMDMPFALADNEAIKVFRVDSDKLIACTSRVADGKLVFETDHFSTFAFVKVNTNAGTKAAPAGAAKTSDDSNMYMWLVIAMAGLGVSIAALMNRKKEQA